MTTPSSATPVAPTDRVSDVIARDESLVDVFVQAAPHFSKLKNRAMRRVMARLITVEQAARTAGIPAEKLVRDLNSALGLGDRAGAVEAAKTAQTAARDDAGAPSPSGAPTRPANAVVRELDVREDLRSGNEPFSKIMAAVAALGDDEVLRLRATFEPVPLFTVLGKRGFVHQSEEHGEEDWSVWFWRQAEAAANAAPSTNDASRATTPATSDAPSTPTADGLEGIAVDENTLVLDVRGLEPPEPLMRTLTALETLPEGQQLLQVNARVPQFLFPMLVERGFACEVDESRADRVLVRIWRSA
jgi:uncharacterized protein (DUF2249 family)